jgi:hypothetical protein
MGQVRARQNSEHREEIIQRRWAKLDAIYRCLPGDGCRSSYHPDADRSDSGQTDESNGSGRGDQQRLAIGPPAVGAVETVAAILERASQITIQAWFTRIQTDARVMSVPLNYDDRCGHLSQLFRDLVSRLLSSKPVGSKELGSAAATEHGAKPT